MIEVKNRELDTDGIANPAETACGYNNAPPARVVRSSARLASHNGEFTLHALRPPLVSDYVKLAALGAIWGSAFMCIEVSLTDFSPLAIAAWRIGIGAAALAGIVVLRRESWPRGRRVWALIVLAGAFYTTVPFTLISWGQQYVSSGMAAILLSCGPFIALALSHFLTRDDRFTTAKLIGTVLGFSGVLVLIGAEAGIGGSQRVAGQLAMIAAVTCYVISSLIVRRIGGVSTLMVSFAALATSSIYMVPLLFFVGEPFPVLSGYAPVTALLFLGLVPTAAAYILRVQIAQQVGATFLAQVSYVIPPFALLWSWLFLDQVPGPTTWLALLLILCGLAVNRAASPRGGRSPG